MPTRHPAGRHTGRRECAARARWPWSWGSSFSIVADLRCTRGRRPRERRGAASRQPAKGRARHQARSAGIVVEEQPADHFARRIEAWNDPAVKVLDLALLGNLEAAELKGHAGRNMIGV